MIKKNKNTDTYAIFGLVVGCIIFGLGSLIVAFVSIGSYSLTVWRLVIAGLVFFAIHKLGGMFISNEAFARENHFPKKTKALGFALLSGCFLAFDLSLWHESIYGVGPGIATLLNSLQIFFVAAIGYVFFKEKLTIWQLVSLLLAIVGVAFIASPELKLNDKALWGLISGVLSGFTLAASMACIRKVHEVEKTGIFPLMMLMSCSGAVITLPLVLIFNESFLPQTMLEVGLTVIYGTVMQCFAWGLIAYSIPRLTLAITGLVLLTEPIAALVIDYVYLHKAINAVQWLGVVLTLVAIYLGSVKTGKTD